MRTVEIEEEVLEAMFDHMDYLHVLVGNVLELMNTKKPEDMLTTKEAARALNISVTTLNNLKSYGKIPFLQIDGRVMYKVSDILEYLTWQKMEVNSA